MKKVVVRHFHEGNDASRKVRKLDSTYATQARVVNLDTGDTLAEEWAFCSPRDVPSRKRGREVALGRLCAYHPEQITGASWGPLTR